MSFLDTYIDKINCEGKLCVVMGDFNIDLLNTDSNQITDDFLNILGTYFFTPHILQPGRLFFPSLMILTQFLVLFILNYLILLINIFL